MSLVIARKDGRTIFLVGDTRLTDGKTLPNETRPDRAQMVSDPRDSAVKITLLSPQIAVAFAGEATSAHEAIQQCRNQSLADLVQILRQSNVVSNNNVEYIVAVGSPMFDIITIKDGSIAYGQQNAFIGDADALNYYWETKHALRQTDTQHVHDDLYYSQQALKAVIESSKFPTVNGFTITVDNRSGNFVYQAGVSMEILPMTISGVGPKTVVIGHGTPQAGGYTVNICPDAELPNILPIHILQGDVGIIYQSKNNGLLHPEVLADTDNIEFAEIILQRFGIPTRFHLSSPIKSYFNRGVKALQKRDISNAIAFLTKALKEPEPDLKSLLHLNLASAYYFSGQTSQAAEHAHEAIRLDSNNYQKWLKIIATGQHP